MKQLSYLCYLLCFSFVFSCAPTASDEGTDFGSPAEKGAEGKTIPNEKSEWENFWPKFQTDMEGKTIPNEEIEWEGFWPKFQMAVASGNKTKVAKLTKFGNHITEEFFNDSYELYFEGGLKTIILNTKAADVPVTEDGSEFTEGRSVAFEEIGYDDDGNEMGSALVLYFGKDEGIFRLLMFFAAG